MEGKIFNDSSNIYQDQARILFNYYKEAAEKIVSQEMHIEELAKGVMGQITSSEADLAKVQSNQKIGYYLCFTIIGLIYALMQIPKIKELTAYIESKKKEVADLKKQHANIFRDYKVEKLGIAYVPVASRVAFNDKSFIVDHTGSTKDEKFSLQILRQNQLINTSINELKDLTSNAPIVEASEQVESVDTGDFSRSIQKVNFHDYFGRLDRTLRTMSFCLSDIDETNVELPVIYPNTAYANFLSEHAANNTAGCPVFNIFNTKQHDDQINGFKELNETRKSISSDSEEVDQTLRHLMADMASSVQTTSTMKVATASSLVDYSNRMMFNILKAPYTFYSPVLEAEEIERIKNESFNYGEIDSTEYKPFDLRQSSRMRFDLTSMCWVDENGGKTITPFGVNQIQSEIMAPIVTNLLKETAKSRQEIYNHIKDQKIDYLNQWHRDTEDFYGRNRAEAADLINLMRGNLAEYTAAYNTLAAFQKTEANMRQNKSLESAVAEAEDNSAEVLMAYQMQSDQFKTTQNEFADYMERLHDDIDDKATKFGHVEHYDASLRDSRSKDLAVATDNVNSLDERRKPLAEVNPLLAQLSDLPPAPSVEDSVYENLGIDLKSLAQEAIENLDSTAYAAPSDDDFEEDEAPIEIPVDDDEEIVEETPAPAPAEPEAEAEEEEEEIDDEEDEELYDEDESDEEDDDEDDEEEWTIGSKATYTDEDGTEIPYDDGDYEDEESGVTVTVKDGIVTDIRNIEE